MSFVFARRDSQTAHVRDCSMGMSDPEFRKKLSEPGWIRYKHQSEKLSWPWWKRLIHRFRRARFANRGKSDRQPRSRKQVSTAGPAVLCPFE